MKEVASLISRAVRDTDGTARLHVVETLVAEFPQSDQNRGIVRDIPTDLDRVDVGVDVLSVTDGDGEPVPYEESRFTDYTGPFMIHCHMLDHEDHGMMARFDVVR